MSCPLLKPSLLHMALHVFCRVLHCQAVLLEWNLDVKCFTMAWSLWTLRVWLKVKKSAARLLLFTQLDWMLLNCERRAQTF